MEYFIVKAHAVSRMCLVCGQHNDAGLHTQFLEATDKTLLARFELREEHQSYPGRTHGGIAAALLDELIGRTVNVSEPTVWSVTMELRCKYRKPLPYGDTVWARARMTDNRARIMEGTGEILLSDGSIAAEAWGRYLKLPLSRIMADAPADLHTSGELRADTREFPAVVNLPG